VTELQTFSGYVASDEEVTAGEADYCETFAITKNSQPTDARVRENCPFHGSVPWPDEHYRQTKRAYMDEAADRLALRELVDTYAHAVDHRLPDLFAGLFHESGQLVLNHPTDPERPPVVFDGARGWEHAFAAVVPFTVTTHFVGNHLVRLDGDYATGSTCCLVHEVYDSADGPRMQLRMARYADTYTRHKGRWVFRTRILQFDWHDDRALGAARDPYRHPDAAPAPRKDPQP
jgi:SnoaL-like domain